MQAPRLVTERLIVGELDPKDYLRMYSYRSHPEVTRFQSWQPGGEEEVRQFVDRMGEACFNIEGSWFQVGIILRSNQELIGDIGLHFLPPDNRQTEIGFTIDPAQQRKGYATEAVGATIDYLIHALHKHRITASVDPKNAASIALLEGIGMRQEAHSRQSVWIDGRWEDDVIYAVLEDEWKSGSGAQDGHLERPSRQDEV